MTKYETLKLKQKELERKLQELEAKLDETEDDSIADEAVCLAEDLANIKYQIGKLECDRIGIDGTLYF